MSPRPAAARLLVLLVALALVLVGSPATADDDVEIDRRLALHGLAGAYTDYLPAETDDGEGVHVVVDFDSGSGTQAEYDSEAASAAELVWKHLELRVVTVVVAPTSGVPWRDGDVPPAVAVSRADLQARHGARPAAFDERGAGFYGSGSDAVVAAGFAVVALLLVALGALGGFFLGRSSGRRAAQRDTWGGGAAPAWGGAGQWGGPPQAWWPGGPQPAPSSGPGWSP
ncbi:MAG TPA: hypothetical protein VM433_07115, partial [Mycobacteriales bacterium]|nr:hypothetical protein [Mycobacteriales bacterium]